MKYKITQRKNWKHWKESWYWSKEKGEAILILFCMNSKKVANFVSFWFRCNYKFLLQLHLSFKDLFLKYSLTLVADIKLPRRLFQVLGVKEDKLWIPSFVFRKCSFNFLLEELVITLVSTTGQINRCEI